LTCEKGDGHHDGQGQRDVGVLDLKKARTNFWPTLHTFNSPPLERTKQKKKNANKK
jgi:hypothetical protein